MHREYAHVKLHATLINSIKRQDDELPEVLAVKKQPRVSFDAYPIMQVSILACMEIHCNSDNIYLYLKYLIICIEI